MAQAMNAVGGPVGGFQMMNNGLAGTARNSPQQQDPKTQLNTYIYDYFIKNELYDCARALIQSDVSLDVSKASPGRRRDADGNPLHNGVEDNSMEGDSKDDLDTKRPDDLPMPGVPAGQPQNSFLQDWWVLFWDIWVAQRKKPKPGEGGPAMHYVQHTQASRQQQRLRQEQHNQMLRQMGPQMPQHLQTMVRMQNGLNMSQQELQRTAMQNNRKPTPQHLAMATQMKQQQQMQREGSNVDVNGDQRPQSPSSAENAPSPSKRPRLDNGFNGQQQMGPNGRRPPQGMPGQQVGAASNTASAIQANHMLIQNGINPNQLTAAQFNSFQQQNPAVQRKSIDVYTQNLAQHQASQNMPKGLQNPGGVPNQGSPMMQPIPDGQMQAPNMENFYNGNSSAQMRNVIGPNGGNHALQDYQMQLMLLEQQNKKRLQMARQEQSDQRPDQAGNVGGQPSFQSMSPQGSRSGPSPNPHDQMKRGTPKMAQAGLPGSPLPDGSMPQARGSPAAMGFNAGQMPPGMTPQLYHDMDAINKNLAGGAPNGAMMRPPSSHPPGFNGQVTPQHIEYMQRQQAAARMPGQNWQQPQPGQAPMAQQPQQPPQQQPPPGQPQPPQQMGTPQQRTAMPPPQAPPAANSNSGNGAGNNGNGGSGRTQPSSPQQPAAPPTPQPANKANPQKKKSEKKAPRKKASTANINAGATPSADGDNPPPTPTPPTPITPQHPSSFTQKGPGAPGQAPGQAAPTSMPAQGGAPMGQGQQSAEHPFGALMDGTNVGGRERVGWTMLTASQQQPEMSLDFALDGENVLEQFDFDSFLNTEDGVGGGMNFDLALPYGNADGLEAGSGDV
ncbi:MAG: hypothetical protein M1832_000990 [Thelocarpon impressellum]|nr:MAG: hypothetical protein M1832_000990 [Thelocarpon impressellum]